MVEEDRPHIVEMSVQGKKTSSRLIRPHLDLVVVAARYEKRLCLVEVNPSDRAVMLLKSINQCSHTVVPELDCGRVKRDKDPWSSIEVSWCFDGRK